ncbi:unnamed protein product, partial [Nippostrongylus brasiliensis]|uniref:Trifunctional purine biosynthetic protein adenosine-3 (inferred by orthology to a human protein) n=1 Tax=Nippostrongylus brasiliensis TaxID=27835 RepID=A0A0N4XHW9_NIPBR
DWDGIVVKADGLAGGKGVVVTESKEAAIAAVQYLFFEFGSTSPEILLEKKLHGYEVSVYENSNFTGGMGVVAPVSVPYEIDQQIDRILTDTVASLRKEGIVYKGVIYAGLMVTADGPQLLEYNCRKFAFVKLVLMRLLKSDLYSVCTACVNGTLPELNIEWDDRHACGIILASRNYPYSGDKGTVI